MPELKLLVDAVQSSKFITEKKSNVDYIRTAIYENKEIKFHYAEWTVKKELKM